MGGGGGGGGGGGEGVAVSIFFLVSLPIKPSLTPPAYLPTHRSRHHTINVFFPDAHKNSFTNSLPRSRNELGVTLTRSPIKRKVV